MRPLAQWRCGPHGGDGNVRHGPAAESSQHKVGDVFPVVGIAVWRARMSHPEILIPECEPFFSQET
jgi:hypothetical protein